MKNLIFNVVITSVLSLMITSCSSSGSKTSSTDSSDSASGSGSSSNSQEGSASSLDSKSGSKSDSSPPDETVPPKKDLYATLQITLGGDDESVIEKTVANLLSQDMGDAKALNTLALYHFSKGREYLAKMIFKNILDKDPKNSVAHNNLGVLYSHIGETRLAIESFRKAVALNGNYPVANANLGSIFAVGRDYGKAKHHLETAYRGGVKDLSVLNNFAVSLMEQGSTQADSIFREALQIGASDSIVSFNYALYLTYVKKDYKEAGALIDKIRFMGVPPKKKQALVRMEETISGKTSE